MAGPNKEQIKELAKKARRDDHYYVLADSGKLAIVHSYLYCWFGAQDKSLSFTSQDLYQAYCALIDELGLDAIRV